MADPPDLEFFKNRQPFGHDGCRQAAKTFSEKMLIGRNLLKMLSEKVFPTKKSKKIANDHYNIVGALHFKFL